MQKVITVAVLAGGLFFAGSAAAQDAETSNDLKCVSVFSLAAAQQTEPAAVMGAGMAVLYFLGRIEGRVPGFDVENGLRIEAAKLTSAKVKSELIRCGGALKSKGEELQAIGRSMKSVPDLKPDT
ncbi:MAG: hypothetical protein Q7T84_20145 [Phenylobacterium sp.]|uniref:hypothetical protein n=1 Tax=Phenylobacterium sp. TaxID=1871053 RepID=UPI0027188ED4|nr:hypothetical protein [Phenylobacterium sp.]MDO9433612.1 hypothetical protein [Phenylobacterium sp.]